MGAADIFEGILAIGSGAAKTFAIKKQRELDQRDEFQRALIAMENTRRLSAEDAQQNARGNRALDIREILAELQGQKQKFFEGTVYPDKSDLIDQQIQRMKDASEISRLNAKNDHNEAMNKLQLEMDRLARLYGDPSGPATPYGPRGAKLGADGKVASGSGASGKPYVPVYVRTFVGTVLGPRSKASARMRRFAGLIEAHPDAYDFVFKRALAGDENVGDMRPSMLAKDPTFNQAVSEWLSNYDDQQAAGAAGAGAAGEPGFTE